MCIKKSRIMAIFLLLVLLFQICIPTISSYALSEENENIIEKNSEDRENVGNENTLETEDVEKNLENTETTEKEVEFDMSEDSGISVTSASGNGTGAGNENEFRNAFYNTSVSELTISQVIRLTSTYTVNHNIRINSSAMNGGNSLHLSSGCNIVVENGCVLTLDGIVVDGRTWGNNDGKVCITIKKGGVLMLTDHAIIDRSAQKIGELMLRTVVNY